MHTIVAVSTPYGSGGIAVIRVSGDDSVSLVNKVWKGADLTKAVSHTAHLGKIVSLNSDILDEAVATIFRGPKSYTGEDTVELSIHGSKWLQNQIVELLIKCGASPAEPGEFTRRAFINGRLDLAQAEGVADLIASSSRASHKLAMMQLSGSFSSKLNNLRERLIELSSLLELELDFSEEDVEFADRTHLRNISDETLALMRRLASTYKAGRAFKEGIPVAIAGRPNAGKSTLLNAILDEEKAIVTDTPGTTRDIIEDTCEIGGVLFRFYDTAGLRETEDTVERIGIQRAHEAISKAMIVLWIVDTSVEETEILKQLKDFKEKLTANPEARHIIIFNKADVSKVETIDINGWGTHHILKLSAKTGKGIEELKRQLIALSKKEYDPDNEIIVTNARHHAALLSGIESLSRARKGIEDGLSADFVAQDIRETIHHLSTLTGQITTDTLLGNIFENFCIGK